MIGFKILYSVALWMCFAHKGVLQVQDVMQFHGTGVPAPAVSFTPVRKALIS
jgi:hypothetical protein